MASEIRALRAAQANDGWTWCTSTIARAGPAIDWTTSVNAAEAFEQRYEGGFRVFELTVDTLRGVAPMVELARRQPTVHWLLDLQGHPRLALDAFVAEARRRDSTVLNRVHPMLPLPEDLSYALRRYPFHSVVYAPTNRSRQTPALALFVRDAGVGVVVLPSQNFTRELATALAAVGARAYVSGVNDSAEARTFKDWGAVGVVTDSLPPQVTCDPMPDS